MKCTIERLDSLWLEANLDRDGDKSIVLFDIDGTIMDTTLRNFRILQEAEKFLPFMKGAGSLIEPDEIGWDPIDDAERKLLLDERQKGEFRDFWSKRFFHDDWLGFDRPYEGIAEVLGWFISNEIQIIYLTGRDEINMKEGTLRSFEKHGLPAAEGTSFLFKPDQSVGDLVFKREAFRAIAGIGKVLLAVENEPENANAMRRAFPEAVTALIDTITAPNPSEPDPGVILFRSY